MSGERRPRRLERVRTRSHRKLKLVLVALGVVSLLIGAGAMVVAMARDNPSLYPVGAVYILLGVGLLAIRQALEVMRDAGRRRRGERRSRRGAAPGGRPGGAPPVADGAT